MILLFSLARLIHAADDCAETCDTDYCAAHAGGNKTCGKLIRDACDCCTVCVRNENEICGGRWNVEGMCEDDLVCYRPESREQTGICVQGSLTSFDHRWLHSCLCSLCEISMPFNYRRQRANELPMRPSPSALQCLTRRQCEAPVSKSVDASPGARESASFAYVRVSLIQQCTISSSSERLDRLLEDYLSDGICQCIDVSSRQPFARRSHGIPLLPIAASLHLRSVSADHLRRTLDHSDLPHGQCRPTRAMLRSIHLHEE